MGRKQKEQLSKSETWFTIRLEKPLKIHVDGELFELAPGKKLTVTNKLSLVREAQRLGAEVKVLKLLGEELLREIKEKGYQVVTRGKKIEEELETIMKTMLEEANLTFLNLKKVERRKSDFKITLWTQDQDNDPAFVSNKLNSILSKLKKQGFEVLLEVLNKPPKQEPPEIPPPPTQEKKPEQESAPQINEKLKVDISKLSEEEKQKLKELLGE